MSTVQDVVYKARALLDTYTNKGVVIGDVTDLNMSAILYADMGQKELYKVGRMEKTISFSRTPLDNKLGFISNFSIEEVEAEDIYLPSENGIIAKAYHLSADLTHEVIIQEYESGAWADLITITGTEETALKDYKANITPTTVDNLIRIKFVADTYYHYSNVALFNITFQNDDSVPSYKPWVEIEMPDDFRTIDSVVQEDDNRQYNQASNYKFEAPNRFYYNYYFSGDMRIIYKPIPTTITSLDQELQIDDIAADALAFYIASYLAPYENQSLVNLLLGKFEELKFQASQEQPASEEFISNIYGGWN